MRVILSWVELQKNAKTVAVQGLFAVVFVVVEGV